MVPIPLYIVEFANPDGVVGHRELVETAIPGLAGAWGIIAAHDRGIDVGFYDNITVRTMTDDGDEQGQLNLFGPQSSVDKPIVRAARLVCPVWPAPNGECGKCGRTDCADHPVNKT